MQSAFKIQTHRMLFDMHHNSPAIVLTNIYQSFLETAMKCYHYVKYMAARARPSDDTMRGKACDLAALARIFTFWRQPHECPLTSVLSPTGLHFAARFETMD